jgi:hypothetical protein
MTPTKLHQIEDISNHAHKVMAAMFDEADYEKIILLRLV